MFWTSLELSLNQILVLNGKTWFKREGWQLVIINLCFQKFAISAKPKTDVEDDKMIFTHIIVLCFGYFMLNQGRYSLFLEVVIK